MVREDILGGLKLAVSKGESLKQAMISFYNAGYKKEEIEEAARALQQMQQQKVQPVQGPIQPQKPVQQPRPQPVQKPVASPQPKAIQRVSGYEQKPSESKGKLVLFVLISVLVILLGALTSLFIFKSEVIGFLDGLFV